MEIEFKKAEVLKTNGADEVNLYTYLPSPMPNLQKQKLILSFKVVKGSGWGYIKENFGLDAEIIDIT